MKNKVEMARFGVGAVALIIGLLGSAFEVMSNEDINNVTDLGYVVALLAWLTHKSPNWKQANAV